MNDIDRNIMDLIFESARMGAADVVRRIDPVGDIISQRDAEKIFGKQFVKDCIVEGLVSYTRKGKSSNSKKNFSLSELEKVRSALNIHVLKVKISKSASAK